MLPIRLPSKSGSDTRSLCRNTRLRALKPFARWNSLIAQLAMKVRQRDPVRKHQHRHAANRCKSSRLVLLPSSSCTAPELSMIKEDVATEQRARRAERQEETESSPELPPRQLGVEELTVPILRRADFGEAILRMVAPVSKQQNMIRASVRFLRKRGNKQTAGMPFI